QLLGRAEHDAAAVVECADEGRRRLLGSTGDEADRAVGPTLVDVVDGVVVVRVDLAVGDEPRDGAVAAHEGLGRPERRVRRQQGVGATRGQDWHSFLRFWKWRLADFQNSYYKLILQETI